MVQNLVIVRHGATAWADAHRHTGRTDVPLTAEGEIDARSVGDMLRSWTFAHVLASPLRRAHDTATLAGFAPALDDDLMEWDYGEIEGRTNDAVTAERPGWSKWHDEVPGGEQVAEVGARVDRVLARCDDLDGDVALFAHGHLLSILIARWLGLEPAQGRRFPLETATTSVLSFKRTDRVVTAINRPCPARS